MINQVFKKASAGHWPIFFLSSFSSIANLFLPIILVRLLTPEDMGFYKIFFLHLSALPFLFLAGGPINSVYYWVGKPAEERPYYMKAVWQLSMLLSLSMIALLPFANQLSQVFEYPKEYVYFLVFAGVLWCPGSYYSDSTIALGKTAKGSLYGTSFEVAKVLLFVALAYFTRDLKLLFISYVAILAFKYFLTIHLGLKSGSLGFDFRPKYLKEVFLYCLPISISGVLSFFVDKVDLLILSSQLTTEDFAFYSMGCLVIPPLLILDMSVQKVLIPGLSSCYTAGKYEQAAAHYQKAISDVAFLVIPSIFGLVIFAEPIVTIFYTEQYLASAQFLQIFALSYLLNLIPHDAVPRAAGKSGWILKIYLLITPITLVAVFLAAKYLGPMEALITSLAIKFIPKFYGLSYSKSIMNWNWGQIFPVKRLSVFTGLSLVLSLVCIAVRSSFSSDLRWFFVCTPIFALIYLGTLYVPFRRNG